MSDFVQAVASRAKVVDERVAEILARYGVRESGILPRPHRLLVRRIAFTGQKKGASAGPVDFSWDLGSGLWCVTADNLRGKSSVLEVIWWCLRGSARLQSDVLHWIHQVSLDAEIDGELFTVSVDTSGEQLTGVLEVGAQSYRSTFTGDAEFASVMGGFMMDRLGLESLRSWRKDTDGSADGEEDDEVDGQVVVTSWPAYSHALMCRNRENDALLGEIASGGTLVSLLQMFVGLPWTITRRDANAALKVLRQSVRGERRRAQQDLQARGASVEELQEQLTHARDAAAQASAAPSLEAAAEAVERTGARLAELAARHTNLVQQRDAARKAEEDLHETLVTDRARLRDMRETTAAQRFFGALQPTCCPRCSTALDELPHADSDDQRCRICGSSPLEGSVDTSQTDELAASIDTLGAAHQQAKLAAQKAAADVDASQDALDRARVAFNDAQAAMPGESALRTYLEVARLEGALQERQTAERRAQRPQGRSDEETVLDAAYKEADKRATAASKTLLSNVSAEIRRLAVRLGMKELQDVNLQGNGTLKLTKGGGASTTFTAVTPGEQLRLRIATLLALLRVGNESGVGRHPGLLLLDSAGAQETIDVDLAEVLSQLKSICDETEGLQVITATAKRDVAKSVVEKKRVVAAGPGEPLW